MTGRHAKGPLRLEDLRGRLTLTVPEAGALAGIGRDASYAAAERGELKAIRVGHRLVVPTHRLLEEVLGLPAATVAQILGLPHADNDAVVQDGAA